MEGREGKVIRFECARQADRRLPPPFKTKAPAHEKALVLPPRVISLDEAAREMSKIFPNQVSRIALADLHFPPKMNFRILPGGIEFCDTRSRRPDVYSHGENASDIAEWTACWHLSLVREGNSIHGKFVDKSYLGRSFGPAECIIRIGSSGPALGELIHVVNESAPLATVRMIKP